MSRNSTHLSLGEVPPVLIDRDTGESRPNPAYPRDRWCKTGHVAPQATRFFAVSGDTLEGHRSGLYCELCLRVANKHKVLQKEGKGAGFNFAAELAALVQEVERNQVGPGQFH